MSEAKKKRGINPVDVLIIIVIIALLGLGGYKLLNRNDGVATPTTPITYTVLCSGVEPEVYESIQNYLPSQMMASGELLDGQVVSVTAEPHEPTMILDSANSQVVLEKEGLLDLTFTIEANVKNPITNEVGTQEVRIGKLHTVKTEYFELTNGVVLTCEWGEAESGNQ